MKTSLSPTVPLPLAAGDAGDVQTKDGQGADHDDTSGEIDPVPEERGQDHRQRSGAEVEREFDSDARHNDVGRAADREDDALQRASFRWGASSASSDS